VCHVGDHHLCCSDSVVQWTDTADSSASFCESAKLLTLCHSVAAVTLLVSATAMSSFTPSGCTSLLTLFISLTVLYQIALHNSICID